MKSVLVVLALAACAAGELLVGAPVAYRVPSHDSAIIQSHRLGGNFAYSTSEAHAYAVQTPIIGQRTVPVGVSYVPGTPLVKTSTQFVTQQVPQYGVAYSQVAAFPTAAGITPYSGLPLPYVLAPAAAVKTEAAAEPVIDTA